MGCVCPASDMQGFRCIYLERKLLETSMGEVHYHKNHPPRIKIDLVFYENCTSSWLQWLRQLNGGGGQNHLHVDMMGVRLRCTCIYSFKVLFDWCCAGVCGTTNTHTHTHTHTHTCIKKCEAVLWRKQKSYCLTNHKKKQNDQLFSSSWFDEFCFALMQPLIN